MAILDDVKTALNVTGTYADAQLNIHIATVQTYLLNAGVSSTAVGGTAAKGAIIRAVADLWNANSGGVDFSPVFRDMAVQLAIHEPATPENEEEYE